jgi:5'-nucleotidase
MSRVALIGSNGQLASDIARLWPRTSFGRRGDELIGLTHPDLEVKDAVQVRSVLGGLQPSMVINTAAYHRVDDCEEQPLEALAVNAVGVKNLAQACAEAELQRLGSVDVIAPLTEQSGVGHAITYLTPLMAREVYDGPRRRGWAVEGSPADCVKLAISELCTTRPQLVVSGVNSGQNAGINVLYSGTVAAAIEGAFFGVTAIAVSLEYDEQARYDHAARLAVPIIEQILAQKNSEPQLFNLNIPLEALEGPAEVRVVPMCVAPWGEEFERRHDPRGRAYFWATGRPPVPPTHEATDLSELRAGRITLSPLHFDMTRRDLLADMRTWQLGAQAPTPAAPAASRR